MSSQKVNEKGMTLVEILAALVILGIVFIGLMTVFPQMTLFNKKTEEKLETMNLARVELDTIKSSSSVLKEKPSDHAKITNDFERHSILNGEYVIEIDCYKGENGKYCSQQDNPKELHKVHIKVVKQDRLISETFGYVKLE